MELVSNKPHNLTFESEITGVNVSQLKGFLRFLINGIEFGIPAKIGKSEVKVSIPPFESFVKQSFEETTKVLVKLEIIGNDFYLNAWEGELTIKPAIKARATPVNVQSSGKIIVKGLKTPQNIDEKIEKAGFTDPRIKELIKRKIKR